jgi:predicted Zn-dependent peptidase
MSLPPVFGQWKREVVPDDIMLPRLFLAFRSPAFGTEDYYAASVCGAVLGLRNGSRLRRRLVRERQVAADASVFTYDLAKGSDLLVADDGASRCDGRQPSRRSPARSAYRSRRDRSR